jgi:hypothetical protein
MAKIWRAECPPSEFVINFTNSSALVFIPQGLIVNRSFLATPPGKSNGRWSARKPRKMHDADERA